MRVSELMSKHVWTIGMSDSCHEAAARLCREKIRHLPVVADDGTLQGIVTDRDLRHHLFGPGVFGHIGNVSVHTLLKAHSVKEIMSFPAVSVEPAASLEDAARLMRERKIGALPVVEAGRVVGILTETDLLRHICRADELCSPEVECIVVSYP
ncbi:MAG: CBS domain-containing protein [Candidatus Rokuibacteriota bacterium]